MARLIVFSDKDRREVDLLDQNTIGRLPKCRIRFHDRIVSNEHCHIFLDRRRGYVIRDLKSLNGTFVNGRRIDNEQVLHNGDEVIIGNSRCIFNENFPGNMVRMINDTDGRLQSYVLSKVDTTSQKKFLPEMEITDLKILRADYEKLRVAYELQREIGFQTEIDVILEQILERTFEFLNCDRGFIFTTDMKGELILRAYKLHNPKENLLVSSTLIRSIQKERIGVISSDALVDSRFNQADSIISQNIRSTLGVPILHQEDLLGIMIIDSLVSANAYSEKDLHLLTNIANQTAQFMKNSQMAKKIKDDALMRERFQRLLSPNLADMVVSGELKVERGGENRQTTVLFADIRDFTAKSENMKATEVLQMLNEYFEMMVEIVFQHEGTVDKFIGDGMMVVWGAPMSHEDDPARAVRAAVEIQSALVGFNEIHQTKEKIQIGIGINTGNVVAGYIGSTRTMSYSVVGDTVNTASRLCKAAKAGQIIVSEDTFGYVQDIFEFERLEPILAKGKFRPIQVFNILGEKCLDTQI
ncbi:MAG: adenylate/guanylate cyclase domain-containing protein [Thermodesulfobacteriota bacterium]|nr:adenylate/guanylate cyclase domain-containing protein [Thermodesulfobacteriota bacterium]